MLLNYKNLMKCKMTLFLNLSVIRLSRVTETWKQITHLTLRSQL